MSSGWPQDQQDLRWPRVPGEDDAWPPDGDVRGEEPESYGAVQGSGDQWAADPVAGPQRIAGQGVGDAWDSA
jgi:hypothetical protein